jgi:hypothetical protein
MLTLLTVIIGSIGALDTESYQFIDRLLTLPGPREPILFDDGVIFTAPSSYRRVGIAFAHEGFSRVYWFKKLLSNRNEPPPPDPKSKKPPGIYTDSGILFYAHTVPRGMKELEYRLIIDGLWTTDPLNPLKQLDPQSGMLRSVVRAKSEKIISAPPEDPPGIRTFRFRSDPGETVTLAGNFNGWDPFLYTLNETRPGEYSITLPLPPGTYQYVFYLRGERFIDPENPRRAYTMEGKPASETILE